MPPPRELVELAGFIAEMAGVLLIIGGLVVATGRWLLGVRTEPLARYQRYRQDLGRGILLGLEVLVAADIVRSVALDPTPASLAVLAMIVAIRTFLSLSLSVELEGRWPWHGSGQCRERAP